MPNLTNEGKTKTLTAGSGGASNLSGVGNKLGQAVSNLGQNITQAGQEGIKIGQEGQKLIFDLKQIRDAEELQRFKTDSAEFEREFWKTMETNTDYADWGEIYSSQQKAWASDRMSGMKSDTARQQAAEWSKGQLATKGLQVDAQGHSNYVTEIKSRLPIVMQSYAQQIAESNSPEERTDIKAKADLYLESLANNGVLFSGKAAEHSATIDDLAEEIEYNTIYVNARNNAVAMPDKEVAQEYIDSLTGILETPERNDLHAQVNREFKQREEDLVVDQQGNFKQVMAQIWNGENVDVFAIRQMYLNDKLTEIQKNKLEEALVGTAMADDPIAFKAVNDAILNIPNTSLDAALDVYYDNFNKLTEATQKAKMNEIYGDVSAYNASIQNDARSRMEELIREKDPLSGLFTDDKKQILASAEADMLLDDAIKEAIAAGKPLEGRDMLIKALEIAETIIRKEGLDKKNEFPEDIITHEIAPGPAVGKAKDGVGGEFTVWKENESGEKVLTLEGVDWVVQKHRGDRQKIIKYIEANGWIVPQSRIRQVKSD